MIQAGNAHITGFRQQKDFLRLVQTIILTYDRYDCPGRLKTYPNKCPSPTDDHDLEDQVTWHSARKIMGLSAAPALGAQHGR